MVKLVYLNGHSVSINDIYHIARGYSNAVIDDSTRQRIRASRVMLDQIVDREAIYGVTTGYGEMVYMLVDSSKETELQTNLIRSHAACVGNYFSKEESKAILAARINTFCRGYSAVREVLVDRMILFLNEGIIPAIPEIGSLGASGDLGPLAHLSITLIGEGYVFGENNKIIPTREILSKHKLDPLQLKYKEGLALINGTSAMTGIGTLILHDAQIQVKQAEVITALVLENQRASEGAFQPEGHTLGRPHQGQIDSAFNILNLVKGSKLIAPHHKLKSDLLKLKNEGKCKTKVYLQKAYTLRCVPQMVGSIKDTLNYTSNVLTIELNSSNDNPLFFEGKEVFHGGNFHGQPVAFVMDFLSIALTQLGVISERRTNRLLNINLNNGLPEFLTKLTPGLNCGFEGAQYPATALVAENRIICTPSSIQSIPSNADNQDVVSMGLIAARNCRRIMKNNNYILAIELLCAAQAIDIAGHYDQLSPVGQLTYKSVRSQVPTLNEDRYMSDDINRISKFLEKGELLNNILGTGIEIR
ncbi:tyrosine 2,3-aminomutase [Candidatus Cardinium hertigii]|uniref:tyrosine 2,3-aminomutase n=1 Tax=Candidatus Cardinium hertigii TaxID=247481 RepID=UPI003D7D47F9